MSYGAIILAGGGSTRMGEDKGLLLLNKKAMVQYSIEAACNADEILISTTNLEYQKFDKKLVSDEIEDLGPLGGIYSCLQQSNFHWNLVLSTDIPLVNMEVINKIESQNGSYQIVVVECEGQIHPLVGFYSKDILGELKSFLETGKRSVQHFVKGMNTKYIKLDKSFEKLLNNINTPQELGKLK